MPILSKCYNNSEIAIDPFQDPEALKQQQNLDTDHNGRLHLNEAQGHVLWAPNGETGVMIRSGEELALFQAMTRSRQYFRSTLGLAESGLTNFGRNNPKTTTEEWLSQMAARGQLHQRAVKTIPPPNSQLGAREILDIKPCGEGYQLLLKFDSPIKEQIIFATLELRYSRGDMIVECAGFPLNLNVYYENSHLQELQHIILIEIFELLKTPISGIPESLRQAYCDRLEAREFQNNYKNQKNDNEKPTSQQNPFYDQLNRSGWSLNAVVDLGIKTDEPFITEILSKGFLTQSETETLGKAIKSVPRYLYKTLAASFDGEKLEALDFCVLEDKHMAYNSEKEVSGYYSKGSVYICRSMLHQDPSTIQKMLTELLVHELGHALLVPTREYAPDALFIAEYRKEIENRSDYSRFLGVSLYQMRNDDEFLAEAILAYVTGETDDFHEQWLGALSRSELRQKQPEMYIALKLFLESDSRGNCCFFFKKNLKILEEMAKNKNYLNPTYSPDQLARNFWKIHGTFYSSIL